MAHTPSTTSKSRTSSGRGIPIRHCQSDWLRQKYHQPGNQTRHRHADEDRLVQPSPTKDSRTSDECFLEELANIA